MKKKSLLSLCAGTICASFAVFVTPTTALASVNTSSPSQKAIIFNQQVINKPYGFVYDHTTYMPIWYLMQALDKLNIQSTWQNKVWSLTTQGQPNLNQVQPGNGSSSIVVNGTLVQKVDELVANDPASGQSTTYMPAWYVMQVLKRLNINSNWNGTIWQIYTSSTAPAIGQLDVKLNTRPPQQRSAPNLGQQIVSYAEKFIGTPYVWGGESVRGFDCSGFVQYVFRHFGVSLPRTSQEQAQVGSVINKSDLQPGDLVYFNTEGTPFSHVGVYVGNGQFISATTSRGVQIKSLSDPYYWGPRYTRSTNPGI
ncbi:C40 family peptidase [Alicyclobacillus mengziensis]|uniref:C40 family peptidase n=1 Tax=Alicyclobacillus mengziensis TaxID=2931921 RepID=A0A9X7W1V0_9BACL|nr:C40 family peptidase [Alicyclobacillus mengziensis]QSO48937.1 C40 family peptidase [Alicyclobacillus mengziensis]